MFALDGTSYEIDLNAKNAAALRKAADKYVAAARRARGLTSGARRSRSSSRRPARNAEVDPKAVRAWAQEQGIAISNRGRIPADVLSQSSQAEGCARQVAEITGEDPNLVLSHFHANVTELLDQHWVASAVDRVALLVEERGRLGVLGDAVRTILVEEQRRCPPSWS